MPIIKKHDIDIYYESHGEGEPLLFVSGLGQKSSAWQFQIPHFSKTMRVIVFDNRGVGKSSRPDVPYTMDMYVEDIAFLLDSLGITEPINLCGLSMGGMISQNFTLAHPERVKSLMLLSTTSKVDATPLIDGIRLMEGMEEERRVRSVFVVYYSKEFRNRVKKDTVLFNRLRDDVLVDETLVKDYINQASAVTETHNTTASLGKIKVPVLIMAGTADLIIHPDHSRSMRAEIPNARLEIIEGAGHVISIESHEKVNATIDEFLKQNA
ncbi:MAG: alpha/beta fold hydrolase [Spirochaetes bacterium]|nr:alpha/beta fold hydrolase [Spirochaetota bacterium]